MVNAWSLLYDEINGTMDETYPIKKKNMKDYDVIVLGGDDNRVTPQESDEYDPIITSDSGDNITFNVPEDSVGAAEEIKIDTSGHDVVTFGVDTTPAGSDTLNFGTPFPGGIGEDHISISGYSGTAYDDPKYYATPFYTFGDDPYPTVGGGNTASASDGLNLNVDHDLFASMDGVDTLNLNIKTKPQPDLTKSHKYEEDKGIKDLKDYVASTYSGHYTSKNNNVQTLDLIQSVGDAESFCRSNAIKYLSRYDKRGQAKRDILKAMHYCLLLYYFSGQTQEDPTQHGYETF